MYMMKEFEEAKNRFKEILEKSRFRINLKLDNVLFLTSPEERQECIFEVIKLLNQRNNANFIFGLSKYDQDPQINGAKVFHEEFSSFLENSKEKMTEIVKRDDFSIIIIEGSSFSPFEKLIKLLSKIKTDLVIIPYPFSNFTKDHEDIDEVIKQLLEIIVLKNNIPLLLLQSCQSKPNFSDIDLIFRGPSVRRDILAWILTFISEKLAINTYKAVDIDPKDYNKIIKVTDALNEKLKREHSDIHFNNNLNNLDLDFYCELMPDEGKLIIFQDIENSDDAKYVYETLCLHNNSSLILPGEN